MLAHNYPATSQLRLRRMAQNDNPLASQGCWCSKVFVLLLPAAVPLLGSFMFDLVPPFFASHVYRSWIIKTVISIRDSDPRTYISNACLWRRKKHVSVGREEVSSII